MTQEKTFNSHHFDIKPIGPGVYAAIHKAGGAAIGNAGIIDLGDSTLVFDTFISPVAAKDLRSAAETLTHKPVTYVFNSHYHNDHLRGNQEFPQAEIISTAQTLSLLQTAGMEELTWDQDNAAKQYQHYLAEVERAQNQAARQQITFWLDYFRVLADSLPGLQIIEPQRTFEDRLTLSGSARTVELLSYGGGHTGSDGFLFVPDAGVLFLADLLFVRCHPYLADGHPGQLINILQRIKTLDADILVPGHGAVGSKKDLELMIAYIQIVEETARASKHGEPTRLLPPFDGWELERFFQVNLSFMSHWLSQEH
jgi:cyclase